MRQYRLQCCNQIATHEQCGEKPCIFCGEKNPICEEIDKEDMVFTPFGFSGDKKHEDRQWGSFDVLLGMCDLSFIYYFGEAYGKSLQNNY